MPVPETLLVFIRSVLAFLWLFFLTRLVGRKQVSELTFTEYVVGITIGSIAAQASTDPQNRFLDGVVGVAVWAFSAFALSYIQLKSTTVRKFIEGEPIVLIARGKIRDQGLKQARLSTSELMELLRQRNVFDLGQVDWAFLETDGQLTVLKKPEHEPLTPKTAGLPPGSGGLPHVVVADGQLLPEALRAAGKDRTWLMRELAKEGVKDVKEVMLAQVVDNQLRVYPRAGSRQR